ncbi:MAG: CAAX prenyl protease-related protein [bacterium]|jgi:CAAX prenyl protease-like protein
MPAAQPVAAAPRPESALPYVLPFGVLIALLALRDVIPVPPAYSYGLRTVVATVVLLAVSRPVLRLRPERAIASIALGLFVFVVWIFPDAVAPGWRGHWIFSNGLFGHAVSSVPEDTRHNPVFLIFRVAGSALLVPVVEELFWRSFLLRWLTAHPFWKVPLGRPSRFAFWFAAAMFGSEHGAYWEVGIIAGVAYNWWMVRTRSLADCILAHAVTNGCLAAYVLLANRWEYWL